MNTDSRNNSKFSVSWQLRSKNKSLLAQSITVYKFRDKLTYKKFSRFSINTKYHKLDYISEDDEEYNVGFSLL